MRARRTGHAAFLPKLDDVRVGILSDVADTSVGMSCHVRRRTSAPDRPCAGVAWLRLGLYRVCRLAGLLTRPGRRAVDHDVGAGRENRRRGPGIGGPQSQGAAATMCPVCRGESGRSGGTRTDPSPFQVRVRRCARPAGRGLGSGGGTGQNSGRRCGQRGCPRVADAATGPWIGRLEQVCPQVSDRFRRDGSRNVDQLFQSGRHMGGGAGSGLARYSYGFDPRMTAGDHACTASRSPSTEADNPTHSALSMRTTHLETSQRPW